MISSNFAFMRSRTAKTKISLHSHKTYEFVYFYSGRGLLEYDETQFEFSAGSYYLMEPNKEHSEFYYNTGKSLVIQFDLNIESDLFSISQNDVSLNLYSLVERIRNEQKEKLYGYNNLIDGLTMEIIIMLSRQRNLKTTQNNHILYNVIAYIDEYFMTPLNIKELAAECNYSEDHFRILFHSITGKNPKEYILSKRIKLAKKQLKETKYSLQAICDNIGFEYYSHFNMAFKKWTGFTPAQYRKTNF